MDWLLLSFILHVDFFYVDISFSTAIFSVLVLLVRFSTDTLYSLVEYMGEKKLEALTSGLLKIWDC